MIYRNFNDGDKDHSILGYGVMRMPVNEDNTINYEEAEALIDKAYNAGVNYYDTAYVYHGEKSEEFIGKVLSKYPRESYFIATKLPMWKIDKQEDIQTLFDEHFRRLGTDYIDYYLTHALNKSKVQLIRDMNIMEWLDEQKKAGKIRHIGFSFHDDLDCLRDALTLYDWDFCQLQINYADWNRNKAKELYEIATEAGVPIIIMEPVRGGMLANPAPEVANLLKEYAPDKSCASWAFRFVANLPNVKLILSGMSTMEQVVDNIATFENEEKVKLNSDELKVLDKAIDVLDNLKSIPCTDCKYCMPCPVGVDIPGCFRCYNTAKIFGNAPYGKIAEDSRADKCIACGACVAVCPQQIEIPQRMEEVAEFFKSKNDD